MSSREDLEKILKPFSQEHLLQFWDELSDEEKTAFGDELKNIDYQHLKELFEKATKNLSTEVTKKDEFMEPISSENVAKKSSSSPETLQKWWEDGLREISEGRVGVVLLAGGQGTRLGVDYPKGMYDVGLPSGKTLYQLQAERIRKLQMLAKEKFGKDGCIKWYIMTSAATLGQTKIFFQKHSYFGLDEENVVFFEQFLLPAFTLEGKLILATKSSLAKSPDGNGGLYRALDKRGVIKDMETCGIKHVHVYCVDNILVHLADPYFTGFVLERNADASNKVIVKEDPFEAVGVTCRCEGKIQVVEYSEITKNTAEKRAEDGSLFFKDANICLHYFSVEFLKRFVSEHLQDIPHHIAKKKIPFIDTTGTLVNPTSPNGIKLEKFVFDVFEFSKSFVIFEGERTDDFSPLKNGPDTSSCSPISCKADLFSLHRSYLKAAGAKFIQPADGNLSESETICEISPLVTYGGEGLEAYKNREFVLGETIHISETSSPPDSPEHKKAKV